MERAATLFSSRVLPIYVLDACARQHHGVVSEASIEEAEQSFRLAKSLAEDAAVIEPDNPLHQSGVAAINEELGKIYLGRK